MAPPRIIPPPVNYLYDRQPWDGGPQGQVRAQFPVPGSRRAIAPLVGAPPVSTSPLQPLDFWGAEAHRYAMISNLVLDVPNGSSGLVLAQPPSFRNFLQIRNISATPDVFIQFGNDASTSSAFRLVPDQELTFDVVVPQNDIFAFATAADGRIAIAVSTITLPPIPGPSPI